MTVRIRPVLVASAFAFVVAAGMIGATLRGESREAPTTAEICATAEWPLIPAECLDGAGERSVRVISGNAAADVRYAASDMEDRFAVAFQ